jgi:uncharacterized membrane protein YhaH (DUF805 family)
METEKKNPVVLAAAILGAALWIVFVVGIVRAFFNEFALAMSKMSFVEYVHTWLKPEGLWDYIAYILPVILAAAVVLNFNAWRKNKERLVLAAGLVYILSLNVISAVLCLVEFTLAKTRRAEAPPKTGTRYFLDACKGLIKPSGRSSRAEYWCFWFYNILIMIIAFVSMIPLLMVRTGTTVQDNSDTAFMWVFGIYSLLFTIVSILTGIRRMHDVDKRGWFVLVPVLSLVLCFLPGTAGENRFGARKE